MIWALIFSSFGDIFLEIDENDKMIFICGLLSFLIAHVLYIRAFWFRECLAHLPFYVIGVLIAYYVTMMFYLLPSAEAELRIPIMIYGFIIALMAAVTGARCYSSQFHKTSKSLALSGALIFVVSDSILAINKFVSPIPNAKMFVMITYYAAQTLLVMSSDFNFVKEKGDNEDMNVG